MNLEIIDYNLILKIQLFPPLVLSHYRDKNH